MEKSLLGKGDNMTYKKAPLIYVTSSKGGVGKTVFTTTLAGVYSILNLKTLIIDLDFTSGGVATILRMRQMTDIFRMHDDIINSRYSDVSNYIEHYNSMIDVIAAPKDPRLGSKIDISKILGAIEEARSKYDVILIDSKNEFTKTSLTMLGLADHILYLVTPDIIDLKNTASFLGIMNSSGYKNIKVILNDSLNDYKNYFTDYDIRTLIKTNIDYKIESSFFIKNMNSFIVEGTIAITTKKIKNSKKKDLEKFITMANSLVRKEK